MINGIIYTFYWRNRKWNDADCALWKALWTFGVFTAPFISLINFFPSQAFEWWPIYIGGLAPIYITGLLFIYFFRHKRYRKILTNHGKYGTKKWRYVTNIYIISFFVSLLILVCLYINLSDKRSKEVEDEDDYGTGLTIIGVSTDDTIQVYPNPSKSDH